ncbi:MAG: tRNA (adenosine(37)-N6)-threonylcarbamoyltransferase complex ATPase subunit type 1 TsaE [Phycisphaerales bacterium]
MTHEQHESANEAETRSIAAALAKSLTTSLSLPVAISLNGELGAGKTTFVRGLAEGLGIDPRVVSSPTFTIMHEYQASAECVLIHIDAWRLRGSDDLASIGWDEIVDTKNAMLVVEWGDRIADALPDASIRIVIEHAENGGRLITYTGSHG